MSLGSRVKIALVGDDARALLFLAAPPLLAIAIDLSLRARTLAGYAPQGKLIYLSSWLISAAFWVWPSWLLASMLAARRRAKPVIGWGVVLIGAWLLPLTTLCFAGQPLYYRVFHAYVGRDTVRLGIALRGTVGDWFASWGGPWIIAAMIAVGATVTLAIVFFAAKVSGRVTRTVPLLPIVTFL